MVRKKFREARRRQVWKLRFLELLTYREIAERLHCSIYTVHKDLKYLEEHPEFIPLQSDENFKKWCTSRFVQLIDEGKLNDWQKAKLLAMVLKSGVVSKVISESEITIKGLEHLPERKKHEHNKTK